jgi:hypothetical protein
MTSDILSQITKSKLCAGLFQHTILISQQALAKPDRPLVAQSIPTMLIQKPSSCFAPFENYDCIFFKASAKTFFMNTALNDETCVEFLRCDTKWGC